MKLKAVAAEFKKNRRLVIYTAKSGEQWITNGYAVYRMDGFAQLPLNDYMDEFKQISAGYRKMTHQAILEAIGIALPTDGEVIDQ